MPTPIETVEAFLAKLGEPGGFGAGVREWFTPETDYINVGLCRTVGIDETIAFVEEIERSLHIDAVRVEILSICGCGNKVLTERIDYMVDAAGKDMHGVPLMGIFEVDGDKIVAWRDYFDSAAVKDRLAGQETPIGA